MLAWYYTSYTVYVCVWFLFYLIEIYGFFFIHGTVILIF